MKISPLPRTVLFIFPLSATILACGTSVTSATISNPAVNESIAIPSTTVLPISSGEGGSSPQIPASKK